jgi:hypothetical protein
MRNKGDGAEVVAKPPILKMMNFQAKPSVLILWWKKGSKVRQLDKQLENKNWSWKSNLHTEFKIWILLRLNIRFLSRLPNNLLKNLKLTTKSLLAQNPVQFSIRLKRESVPNQPLVRHHEFLVSKKQMQLKVNFSYKDGKVAILDTSTNSCQMTMK